VTDHEWPEPDFEPEYGGDGDLGDLGGAETADLSQPYDNLDLPGDELPEPDLPGDGGLASDAGYAEPSYGDDAFADDLDDDADAPGDATGDVGDPPVGADPDLDPVADHDGQPLFPPALDLDPPPQPVDGFPWADPATLGEAPLTDPVAAHDAAPDPSDLASYAAQDIPPGADPWTALAASEDPATSSLARWWSQGT
jgi:hypothetical protein